MNSPVRAFGAVGGDPVFIASGHGPYLTDVDGKRCSLGSWIQCAPGPRPVRAGATT